jgi:hypothetical protein
MLVVLQAYTKSLVFLQAYSKMLAVLQAYTKMLVVLQAYIVIVGCSGFLMRLRISICVLRCDVV